MRSRTSRQPGARRCRSQSRRRRRWWPRRSREASGDDVCVMLYTSGTTGRLEGRDADDGNMRSRPPRHGNEFDRFERRRHPARLSADGLGRRPLSSTTRRPTSPGFCMSCPESPETVPQDLREIGPTFYFAPPRIFENLLTSVMVRMEDAGWLKRKLFHVLPRRRARYGEAILEGKPVALSGRMLYRLGDLLVYAPLRNLHGLLQHPRRLYGGRGDRARSCSRFFRSLGINLKQLYGQTEACRLRHACSPTARSTPTPSGKPRPDVEIKIADNGEVLFRTPRRVPQAISRTTRPPPRPRRRTAGSTPATPASSTSAATSRSSTAPRTSAA